MSYQWHAAAGEEPPSLIREFPDQEAAEEWLGQHYLELADDGHDRVWLYEENRLVYGPMGLAD